MTKEKLITQLCEVIKESELNAANIVGKLDTVVQLIEKEQLADDAKSGITTIILDAMNLLQCQDLHRQKIERVVNFVCEEHGIDASHYNLASSAKCIDKSDVDDAVSDEELEALIKQMT